MEETIFESVLKDTNYDKAIFDLSLKSFSQKRNKWLTLYNISTKSKFYFLFVAIFTLITYNIISFKKTKHYKFLMMRKS